jgi:glycosyltransferase involved in cell wall biosynthesis
MRLVVDGVGAKQGGTASVLLGVLRAALRNNAVQEVHALCSPARLRRFELPSHPRLQVHDIAHGEGVPLPRMLWQGFGVRAKVQSLRGDALVLLGGGGIPPRHVRSAVLVQQCLPFVPEALALMAPQARLRMRAVRWSTRRSCLACQRVLVQTPWMRGAVSTAFGLSLERVIVTGAAGSELGTPDQHSRLAERFRSVPADRRLLYVGDDYPHKNLSRLVDALQLVRRVLPGTALFVTLPPGSIVAHAPGVVALGYLTQGELATAYSFATALVMPSIAESAGLPLLEAGAAGCPIVVADRPYARDICGSSASYFDPLRVDSMEHALVRALSNGFAGRERWANDAPAQRGAAEGPYDAIIAAVMN